MAVSTKVRCWLNLNLKNEKVLKFNINGNVFRRMLLKLLVTLGD